MFASLSEKIGDIFGQMRRRAHLREEDIDQALRAIRIALLEADVALPVVKKFIADIRQQATGQEVLRSVTPAQQVVKIVHDHLVSLLGGEDETSPGGEPIHFAPLGPTIIMMAGLQGSGKTTTAAKLARRLREKRQSRVLLASLDIGRPAAQEQLAVLAQQAGVESLPIIANQDVKTIAIRACNQAREQGYDVVILDSAGRLSIDEALMAELQQVVEAVKPHQNFLVADAMTGQDAVQTAQHFAEGIALTGLILTRVDGDARGGAALSMRAVTGKPICYLGQGERLDALEVFHADRIAGRILGMGDVVSLVEKAQENIDQEQAEKLAQKLEKGKFDLDDMRKQLQQMRKMGGFAGLMGLLPGMGKIKQQIKDAAIDDKLLIRQEAIISSMTREERRNPKIIRAKRKKRIALGSGTAVQDVNKLLKQFEQMNNMMKLVRKGGGLRNLGANMPGGMPQLPPELLSKLPKS